MTGHPNRDIRRRRFHLHCSCGAVITSSEATATCEECGREIIFRRNPLLRKNAIIAVHFIGEELPLIIGGPLLIALAGYFAGVEGLLLALIVTVVAFAICKADSSPARTRASETRDSNIRYLRLGRLILAAAALLAVGYTLPGSNFQEWAAVAKHPKPRDCDLVAWPFGDKHCHYEPSFTSSQQDSGSLVVNWVRAND